MENYKLKMMNGLNFKIIVRLVYTILFIVSLVLFMISKNPIVVHFDAAGNMTFGDKLHLFIGVFVMIILGECLIKQSSNCRIQTDMMDFPFLTAREGRYLAGIVILAAIFIGLMFDQVGITRIFY